MLVRSLEDLRVSPTASLFEGGREVGEELPVSCFVTRYATGQGPRLHEHPYPELFVVTDGAARFAVAGRQRDVAAGHVVVVPAHTEHAFRNEAGGELRMVSVQPSPEVIQWLSGAR